jgi:hypothetical protein
MTHHETAHGADRLVQAARAQLPLRLAAVAASAIAVAALGIAGSLPGWLLVALAILTIAACALPDTVIPALFVAAYATSWVALTDRGVTIWLLAAALGLGGFHLATAAAGTIPPRGDLPRTVARRWLRHGGTVAVITLAVWLLAVSFDAIDSAPNAALAAAGLLVVAVGGYMLSAGSHTGDH